jgi:hypothetical protein
MREAALNNYLRSASQVPKGTNEQWKFHGDWV